MADNDQDFVACAASAAEKLHGLPQDDGERGFDNVARIIKR
jgi:hypothetical protein